MAIARQFRLVSVFVGTAFVAFLLVARSLWITTKDSNIPYLLPIFWGCSVAILAERYIRHLAALLTIACLVSILHFSIFSWESMQNAEQRDFPHVIPYHYSGDLDLHIVAGVSVLIGTLILGGGLTLLTRCLRGKLPK